MKQYLDRMQTLLDFGNAKADRTGVGTLSLFGTQMRFKLLDGFPLITTKKVHLRSIIHELLWFLRGETNIKSLNQEGVTIWDEWADGNGDLGPIYGAQWRSWPYPVETGAVLGDPGGPIYTDHKDQIQEVLEQLKGNPDDRRMIVSAWNVGEVPNMALPPCHLLFQFYTHHLSLRDRLKWEGEITDGIHDPETYAIQRCIVARGPREAEAEMLRLTQKGIPERGLSCQMYQRSCDWFLGVPFNIASYSLLTMMVAQVVGMIPYEFIWTGGDYHLYLNHRQQAKLQLEREPRALPWMNINRGVRTLEGFRFEDFELVDYNPYDHIKAPVAT